MFFVISSSSASLCCLSPCAALIFVFVAMFIWFLLGDRLQLITDSINDLGVDIADPEA